MVSVSVCGARVLRWDEEAPIGDCGCGSGGGGHIYFFHRSSRRRVQVGT